MMTMTYLYCTVRLGTVLVPTPTHKVDCRGMFFSFVAFAIVVVGLFMWHFERSVNFDCISFCEKKLDKFVC